MASRLLSGADMKARMNDRKPRRGLVALIGSLVALSSMGALVGCSNDGDPRQTGSLAADPECSVADGDTATTCSRPGASHPGTDHGGDGSYATLDGGDAAAAVFGDADAGPIVLAGMKDDGKSHPPPSSGPFAYNSFVPAPTAGASYADPVFGGDVRRLTTDHDSDDIYARNMWWSADETRYLHRAKNGTPWADFWNVIDVATGAETHSGIGIGTLAGDGGFDPVDPNVLYVFRGSTIHKVTLGQGGKWTETPYFTAPGGATLESLGGTLNWLDASGRYMVVRYGPEPSVHVYDRQNLAAGPYANAVDGGSTIGAGHYVSISPDGKYLVGYQAGGLGMGQGVSWKLDHANRQVAANKNVFWTLCGDHGAFISTSDGRDYMVVFACNNTPGVWRVDITNNAAGLNEAQQLALPNNKLLVPVGWKDGGHFSTTARGPLRDWAFYASEDGSDGFNGATSPWHVYRQEIIAINVVTGEIRRLAHHRSRSLGSRYEYMPRLSASWGGKYVGWASNFNQNGVIDVFAVRFRQ